MGLKGVVPDRIFRRIHFLGCGRCRVILRQLHTEFGDESHWDPPEHNVLIFVFTHSVLTTRTSDEPSQRSKGLTIYKPSPGRTCRIKWMLSGGRQLRGFGLKRRKCIDSTRGSSTEPTRSGSPSHSRMSREVTR